MNTYNNFKASSLFKAKVISEELSMRDLFFFYVVNFTLHNIMNALLGILENKTL